MAAAHSDVVRPVDLYRGWVPAAERAAICMAPNTVSLDEWIERPLAS